MAKLAVMELPEPDNHSMYGYTKEHIRQAYAQGAASQLAQAKADYEWQERNIKSKVDRFAFNLFTRKEPS